MLKKYKHAIYYECIEKFRPDEELIFQKISEIVKEILKGKDNAKVLDLCCGTGLSMEGHANHENISLLCGVDCCEEFLDYANYKYGENEQKITFLLGDVMKVKLPQDKWDIITIVSGYHHIHRDQKLAFLRRVRDFMHEDSYGIIAENIIPQYTEDTYRNSIISYYKAVYQTATESHSDMPELVLQFLKKRADSEYETDVRDKVSYQQFVEDIEKSGLWLVKTIKVWPTEKGRLDSTSGNFLFIVKRQQ